MTEQFCVEPVYENDESSCPEYFDDFEEAREFYFESIRQLEPDDNYEYISFNIVNEDYEWQRTISTYTVQQKTE